MEYEGQICRGPMESGSFMLPVAVGCAYNRCIFCTLFKHLKYRMLPMEQIVKELMRVHAIGGNPKTVFLGDGNAFGLPTEHLLQILEHIHRYFPGCESINMDATVTDIRNKTDEELRQLRREGVRHLYLGIESGLDDVLDFMKKDHTLSEAYREIARIQENGLIFDAHIMTGVAGAGRGEENAEYIADFFRKTKPRRIINFSMFLHKKAPLYREILNGRFTPADERENLIEEKRILELLETDLLSYDGFHDMIQFRVKGELPHDRKKMLQTIDQKLQKTENGIIAVVS